MLRLSTLRPVHGLTADHPGGCRCSGCRHNRSYHKKPARRVVLREQAIRRARQHHPRNAARPSWPSTLRVLAAIAAVGAAAPSRA